MKKLLLTLVAAASLGGAIAPAAAQPIGPYYPGYHSIDAREASAARRIAWCQARGFLTRYEAIRLRTELRQIHRLEAILRQGGLTRWEYMALSRRLSALEAHIRTACRPDFHIRDRVLEREPRLPIPDPGPRRVRQF